MRKRGRAAVEVTLTEPAAGDAVASTASPIDVEHDDVEHDSPGQPMEEVDQAAQPLQANDERQCAPAAEADGSAEFGAIHSYQVPANPPKGVIRPCLRLPLLSPSRTWPLLVV